MQPIELRSALRSEPRPTRRVGESILPATIFFVSTLVTLALAAMLATPLAAQPAGTEGGPPLLLRGARVFLDQEGAPDPMPTRDLWIENGRIARIAAADTLEPTGDAHVLELDGRFVLPGLVDSHAHVALGPIEFHTDSTPPRVTMLPDLDVGPRSLRTLLAYGVTLARDPGGPAERTVALRNAVRAEALLGPRLVVAGDVIDQAPFEGLTAQVSNEAEVRSEVQRQAELGVDLIKLYASLPPDLVRAGVDEARRHGLPAVAHLLMTTWTEGADAGLHSILHVIPGSPRLLPEEHRGTFMRDMRSTVFMYTWFEFVDFESAVIREMVDRLVEQRTWVDPTLVVFEIGAFGDDPGRTTAHPDLRLADPDLVANWTESFRFDLGWSDEDRARAQAAWPRAQEFIRRLHQAGVRLTAGTDANNPWTIPGPSLHRELELLTDAGLSNLEVLRIATRNGAEALGRIDETGTLAVGKRADLIVVRENPLEDISATRTIDWVLRDGHRWRPADLLAPLLAAAPEDAATSP